MMKLHLDLRASHRTAEALMTKKAKPFITYAEAQTLYIIRIHMILHWQKIYFQH